MEKHAHYSYSSLPGDAEMTPIDSKDKAQQAESSSNSKKDRKETVVHLQNSIQQSLSPIDNTNISSPTEGPEPTWNETLKKYITVFLAEFVGTGFLICVGCMSGISAWYENGLPVGQSAIGWGMVVACVIQIFGHISAAHFNPAVTVCFYVLGDITLPMAANYFAAEFFGALLGFGVLKAMTPESVYGKDPGLCCTVPHESMTDAQSFLVELISTAFLILLVCSCCDPRNAKKQDSVPLKFGVLVAAVSMISGPYTGASINPTRSFAPAFWNGVWTSHWIYWIAPLMAGFIVPIFYQMVFRSEEGLRITRSLSRRIRAAKRT